MNCKKYLKKKHERFIMIDGSFKFLMKTAGNLISQPSEKINNKK
jgi:hypothetical protein